MKYNINQPISPFIKVINPRETFIDITDKILPGVYPYYMVSNFGRVYHKYTRQFLKPGLGTSGYLFVYLSTDSGPVNFLLHRLVLIAFDPVPNYKELQVNHINGIKTCNELTNLEWCTRSENQIHAYKTGLHQSSAMLNENEVYEVCELIYSNKYTLDEIAQMYNVKVNVIASIKQKKSWESITSNYNFQHRPGKLFNDDDLNRLCLYFQENPKYENETVNDLCRRALINCGFEPSDRNVDSIRKLYTRKNFTHISKYYNY